MQGQWLGSYKGNNEGVVTIELDDLGDHFEGMAYCFPNDLQFPALGAAIKTVDRSPKFSIQLKVDVVDRQRGILLPWDAVKEHHPGVVVDPTLDAAFSFDLAAGHLQINYSSKSGGPGKALLSTSNGDRPPTRTPKATISSWASFKDYALSLDPQRYVFRGQESNAWRLRTFFHRAGRADLFKFVTRDIGLLHAQLSSLTQHQFNLDNNLENAAFYSLVQHHGYPTPLLDWTWSPFIAAYFAFRKKRALGEFARIFVFDQREWQRDIPRSQLVSCCLPHFSFLNPLAINNPRMVPQQALSIVANVHDIEDFIDYHERSSEKAYLEVIDLPVAERPQIMQELSLMGITAGSMFPGLDGACEQLRERNFNL